MYSTRVRVHARIPNQQPSEDPRKDVGVDVGVGVVEFHLYSRFTPPDTSQLDGRAESRLAVWTDH